MSSPRRVTLAEWAARIGRPETSVRNHWRPLPGFPAPVGRRATPGPGPGPEEYDVDALDAFRAAWEADRARPTPPPYPLPGDPDERLTLGAIARRLGVAGRTLTQYRATIDARVPAEHRGARRYYPLGAVIDVLNDIRRGAGVASDPGQDRRRKNPSGEPDGR